MTVATPRVNTKMRNMVTIYNKISERANQLKNVKKQFDDYSDVGDWDESDEYKSSIIVAYFFLQRDIELLRWILAEREDIHISHHVYNTKMPSERYGNLENPPTAEGGDAVDEGYVKDMVKKRVSQFHGMVGDLGRSNQTVRDDERGLAFVYRRDAEVLKWVLGDRNDFPETPIWGYN